MIIADTSLIAELWLPGQKGEIAISVLGVDAFWSAPILWRSEFRSTLSKYFRANLINIEYAQKAMLKALEFMRDGEVDIDSKLVIDIISLSNVSAYDAEYVALAIQTGNRLISFDQKLINLFPDVAMHPSEFIASASS